MSVSGGDDFAYFFRKRRLGKIIGTRTIDGMVGTGPVGIRYVDGGYSPIPIQGSYDETGKSIGEGYGIEPDIQVIDEPSKMLGGADPQLDKAIQQRIDELKKLLGRSSISRSGVHTFEIEHARILDEDAVPHHRRSSGDACCV